MVKQLRQRSYFIRSYLKESSVKNFKDYYIKYLDSKLLCYLMKN